MIKMMEIKVCDKVLTAIKKHAKKNKDKEIYGWLIGFDYQGELYVTYSVPCIKYIQQELTIAEPSHEEVIEISRTIPAGIGIIGIYHSHTGEVYHSSTDDSTIKQFSSVYPYFVSIVTNITETKIYQLIDDSVKETPFQKMTGSRSSNGGRVLFKNALFGWRRSNKNSDNSS